MRDVVVRSTNGSEVVAVSPDAAPSGETMRLDLDDADGSRAVEVEVIDSRPTVLDGAVRHQLRLRILGGSSK